MRLLVVFLISLIAAAQPNPRQEDSLRRAKMAELFYADDKDGFLQAARDLVEFHKTHGSDKQLFDAYATLFDRQQMWGRYDDAVATIDEMSQVAQGRRSRLGTAVAEFCTGQLYLNTRQPAEAEIHYRRAFNELKTAGENGRALRAGFNLQACAMNLGEPEAGLAMNDSTAILISDMEARSGRANAGNHFKQARYRFVLLQRTGRLKEAAPLKDTLLHYAAVLNDPSQDEIMLTAIAQYEQAVGNRKEAYACLDTLIARNLKARNFNNASRFRLSLADFQRENGDLDLAVDNYRLYSAESDSARIQDTHRQLNELTKKFELDELRMENEASRQRNTMLGLIVAVMAVLLVAILVYNRQLRRKNRILFSATQEHIKAEEEAEEAIVHAPEAGQTAEEKLYASLIRLMQEEELFKDADLNRDILCARLGTNRTYISNAVKQCFGGTLNAFINHFRLRWSAEALAGRDDLSVLAVGEDAGFSSRSTFHRLFQEAYGMSPSAYRAASKA